jgi:hypothetical protein
MYAPYDTTSDWIPILGFFGFATATGWARQKGSGCLMILFGVMAVIFFFLLADRFYDRWMQS